MGTPEIAATILSEVLKSEHEVLAVVTQPDKPKGRGHEMAFPPVKEVALAAGIPVLQPLKARDPEFLEELERLNPDIMLVAAYGKMLPKTILDLPKFGCIKVHASLLP
jgi:methionyl-tRNA formyltransferase